MIKVKFLFFFLIQLLAAPLFAQAEMADSMRAEGKIYVVVAIILIVLAGIFFYLFLMDKKIKKLENLLRENKDQTN